MNTPKFEVIPGPGVLTDKATAIERAQLVAPFVEWVQIDIADNKLVPNETFLEPSGMEELMKLPLSYELHMMVEQPALLSEPWVQVGFKRLIWHIEAYDPLRLHVTTLEAEKLLNVDIERFKKRGIEVGLAIDKDTAVTELFPYLDSIDCVLVMTIAAGFSGQSFIPELLEKAKAIRSRKPDLPIEVDGGINFDTAALSVKAGVTRLVSTSTLYNADNIGEAIEKMRTVC